MLPMGHSSSLKTCLSQGGRAKGAKSRLGRTARLEETANKAAVADALGLSTDKEMSLGAKMGSLALGSKGALSAKLPIIAASNLPRTEEKSVRREAKPARATPPQVLPLTDLCAVTYLSPLHFLSKLSS